MRCFCLYYNYKRATRPGWFVSVGGLLESLRRRDVSCTIRGDVSDRYEGIRLLMIRDVVYWEDHRLARERERLKPRLGASLSVGHEARLRRLQRLKARRHIW